MPEPLIAAETPLVAWSKYALKKYDTKKKNNNTSRHE